MPPRCSTSRGRSCKPPASPPAADTDTLRLVRRALAQAQCPIPPALEIRSFPSQHGLLCFVSPLPEAALSPKLEPAPLS